MTAPAFAAPALPTLTRQEKIFTIVGALLGMLLAALDQTIVATAGPAIQKALVIDPSLYSWMTTSYFVTSTMMVPIYGKLSDIYGRKPILLAGITIFLLGSILCGLANEAWFLIISRGIQGIGSAALFTSAFSIISDIFPPSERGKYAGLFGGVFGISSVIGPLLGGFITDHFGWHWVFYINVPVGLLAISFIVFKMPYFNLSQSKPRIDYLGAMLIIVFSVPLLLALSLGKSVVNTGELGFLWGSWEIIGMFLLSILGFIAFIYTELRVKDPMVELSLFKNRTFSVGSLATFVLGMTFFAPIFFLPIFMVAVVGLSATNSGLTITPLTLGLVAGNIISGQLVSRVGRYKTIMLVSLVVLGISLVVFGFTLTPTATQLEVTLKMILVGLGLGPTIPIYTLAIQNAVDFRKVGSATSTATFLRQMGSTIGIAIFGSVFANTFSGELTPRIADATKDAPPAIRAQFATMSTGGAGESRGQLQFNAGEIKTQLGHTLDAQAQILTRALRDNDPVAIKTLLDNQQTPAELRTLLSSGNIAAGIRTQALNGALAGIEQTRQNAFSTIDRVGIAFKESLTNAISLIYRLAVGLAVLAFLITLGIPELPLRKAHAPIPIAE